MICVVLNKDFIPGFQALINSIKAHTDNFNQKILCLNIDLDQNDKRLCLEIWNNIEFVDPIYENYKILPKHSVFLKNAFYKLELFRLASIYDNLVFIDCDIIFLKDMSYLLEKHNFKEDVMMAFYSDHNVYNTGVIILNKIRISIYERAISILRSAKNAKLADQDIIKAMIRKGILKVSRLPIKWNLTKRRVLKGNKTDPTSIHFVGIKPWKGSEPGYAEIEKIWHAYYNLTQY